MRIVATVLCLALAALSPLHAASEEFTVIIGGNPVGHVKVTQDAANIAIDFDIKNNGRGPTIAETLRLDAAGLPTAWTITGATTFGSKVDEMFARDDESARWRDSTGEGRAESAAPRLYIGQSASPWALGMYARALLAAADRKLPVHPGGELTLAAGDALQVSDGKTAIEVRQYTISGLDLDPSYILLDADNALFATISSRGVVVRRGFEAEEQRLREIAVALGQQRFESIQARTAHRYAAPVRISNVRVFDPASMRLSAAQSVLVHDRRITGLQPLDTPAVPGEVLIDGEGGTLVPGMYEMHAHGGENGAILNIAAGVTSSRDMGNDNAVLDALIRSIEAGRVGGPRIARSGFIEGKSPFNSNNGILVSSQAQALDAVRWYAARGFIQVKLYNSMNPAWTAAAVTDAHRLGLRASGHVPAFSNADAMIAAGYDELTHINQIMLGWVLAEGEDTRTLLRLTALKRLQDLDLKSPPVRKTFELILANKVAVEPTIAIHENLLLHQSGRVPRGAADIIDNMPTGWQRNAKQGWTDMSAPGDAEAYAAAWDKLLATVREMHQRGVLLIPGTDLGGGLAYHRELMLFEKVGFSPAQTLKRATLDMAEYLEQEQSLGSIERGKLADFFLVPGDPTTDLAQLRKIRMVVKDGTVYFPSEIYTEFGIKPFASAPVVSGP